jgi:hypothetical protein
MCYPHSHMHRIRLVALLALLVSASNAFAQVQPAATPYYSRRNTFGLFGEYSNDSSHMFLGFSEQRKLLNFGGMYSRRLYLSRIVDWQYMAELRPVILESDPVYHVKVVVTSPPSEAGTFTSDETFAQACHPFSKTFTEVYQGVTYSQTETVTCGRRWTFGEGFSPVGFKWNFFPRHRLQPVFTGLGGYMFSTQPIPVSDAGSFNFTFEFGVGVEFYRSKNPSDSRFGTRSIRAEYRYHHISNDYTAAENPGIDSGMLQVTYAFGR